MISNKFIVNVKMQFLVRFVPYSDSDQINLARESLENKSVNESSA